MKSVILEKDKRGVATVSLNRPDKHNAFDEKVIATLSDTFDEISADDSLRVLILQSEGKNFSAGLIWTG